MDGWFMALYTVSISPGICICWLNWSAGDGLID